MEVEIEKKHPLLFRIFSGFLQLCGLGVFSMLIVFHNIHHFKNTPETDKRYLLSFKYLTIWSLTSIVLYCAFRLLEKSMICVKGDSKTLWIISRISDYLAIGIVYPTIISCAITYGILYAIDPYGLSVETHQQPLLFKIAVHVTPVIFFILDQITQKSRHTGCITSFAIFSVFITSHCVSTFLSFLITGKFTYPLLGNLRFFTLMWACLGLLIIAFSSFFICYLINHTLWHEKSTQKESSDDK